MRIAMIGARNIPARHGGLEVAAEQLSRELVGMGNSVTAYVDSRGALPSEVRALQIQGVPALRTKYLHTITQTLSSVPPLILSRPDIAHFHGVGPATMNPIARVCGSRSVVTVQGLDWQRDKWGALAGRAFGFGVKSTLRHAEAIISVSRAVQRSLRDQLSLDSIYIPNGVRTPPTHVATQPLDDLGVSAGNYILFAARLVPEKGLHTLLEAYRSHPFALPLVVAGSGAGSYASDYERQLRENAPVGVKFVGFQEGHSLRALFAHAALYVLPSSLEGLPLSLLEAMSFGLPVVHSAIPECLEITRGDAGLSFPVGDSVALAATMKLALHDNELARAIGQAARQRVAADYSWPNIAKETTEVYLSLLGAKRRRVQD